MTVVIPEFTIESDDPPDEAGPYQQLLKQWKGFYEPTSPIDQGLIEQAVTASLEIERCRRIRTTLRTEKVRTADLFWVQEQEDQLQAIWRKFPVDCVEAWIALQRSAVGVRYMITEWERLERQLREDGTWYGTDVTWAIQLQGYSARPDQIGLAEGGYITWLDCLAAQPNPKQRDIDHILAEELVPTHLREKGVKLWPRDPEDSRRYLQAIVDQQLGLLRPLEKMLREKYEEPARAAAKDQALARSSQDEVQLLRELRSHEAAYQRATAALLRARKLTHGAGVRRARVPGVDKRLVQVAPRNGFLSVTKRAPNEAGAMQVFASDESSDGQARGIERREAEGPWNDPESAASQASRPSN